METVLAVAPITMLRRFSASSARWREGFAVSAGGFEAGVDALDILLGEPLCDLLKAGRRVRETLCLSLPLSVGGQALNSSFGNVNSPAQGMS